MKIVKKKLSELHPLEKNVRRHSQTQINEYVRSLEKFEQLRPLVIDENGVIWIGNGMFEAMKAMGWEYAECEVRTGLSENDKKKMMLADNRIYELGMTDTDVFDEIIRSLDGDVDVPGWPADLLETLNASVQEVNEMVDSYGSYPPEDIARFNERRPVPQNTASGELQQPSAPLRIVPHPDTYPETEAAGEATEAPAARFVICPKCGERIEIGGV